ncbi:MAG: hypothetical protein Q8R18_05445 [bacterium]|nr:hypothetical protein [bacterium]
MDISLNFIILAVLALIALIVIALFFTGGLTNLFGQTEDVGSISAEKIALYSSKCKFYCTTGDEASWLNPRFEDETLKGKSCENADSILKHGKKLTDSDSDGETDDCVNV